MASAQLDQAALQTLTTNSSVYLDQAAIQTLSRNPPAANVEGLLLKVLALESTPTDYPTLTITVR